MIVEGSAEAAERRTQQMRGVLDMCMLAMLADVPAHGYDLVRRLNDAGFDTVGYGTVYPLLTRMKRLGLVATEQAASPAGPPRKVYALTEDGGRTLRAWTRQWQEFVAVTGGVLAATASATAKTEE